MQTHGTTTIKEENAAHMFLPFHRINQAPIARKMIPPSGRSAVMTACSPCFVSGRTILPFRVRIRPLLSLPKKLLTDSSSDRIIAFASQVVAVTSSTAPALAGFIFTELHGECMHRLPVLTVVLSPHHLFSLLAGSAISVLSLLDLRWNGTTTGSLRRHGTYLQLGTIIHAHIRGLPSLFHGCRHEVYASVSAMRS